MKSRLLVLILSVVYATIPNATLSVPNPPSIPSSAHSSDADSKLIPSSSDDEVIHRSDNGGETSLFSPPSFLSYLFPFAFSSSSSSVTSSSSSSQHLERSKRWASPGSSAPPGLAKLIALDVICGKDHMTVRAEFNGPFNGIVFSKGTYGQENCVYVKPYSGVTHTTFKVNYDSCGTKPDLQGKYYENTIVVQYGTDIIEAWDEAKRLRCEWFEAYEKPATFRPAIPVADLDVIEMNFQGDDIDCWMEIQEGKGPWAREVNRIVPVGQPMTIVVSINDYNGQFDMRVKSCFAHDGIKPPIHLTDEHGCVLRPKMLSGFNKIKDPNGKATVISYSHFYAFKFPDTMNVQIQCTVEVCRHGCPEACQKGPYPTPVREIHPKVQLGTGERVPAQPSPAASTHHHQISQPNAAKVKDEEPKPVYQEVGSNRSPVIHLPGITDQTIAHHATQFLADQGVDISSLKAAASGQQHHQPTFFHEGGNPFSDESREQAQFATINATSDLASSASSPASSEDDSKPVIKVVEIDVPADKKKPPTITEQTSMFPSDLTQANKILADLGLNMDLNSFASNIMKNPKELSSILQNDQVKQLANAAGFSLNNAASLLTQQTQQHPQAQPLVNFTGLLSSAYNPEVDVIATTKIPGPIYESGDNHETTYAQQNRTTPQPAYSNQAFTQPQQQMSIQQPVHQPHRHVFRHPHPGHIHQHLPPRGHQQPIGHSHISVQPQQPLDAPIVQVMNIPLQPGLPAMQMPPAFTNFIHLPANTHIPPPKVPKRPLFNIPSFLPSFSALNPFSSLNTFSHSKDRVDSEQSANSHMSSGMASSQQAQARSDSATFPQGPRSMRLKRSVISRSRDSQVSVNKGFQVVTAIDLAFFPNATTDNPEVYEGRPEEVVYGVCMPMIAFAAAITCILLIIIFSIIFSVVMVYRINKRSRKHDNHIHSHPVNG